MIATLKLLVRKMKRTNFKKLTHPKRLQVLALYRELSDPMDELWKINHDFVLGKPQKTRNVLVKRKIQSKKKVVKRKRR